MGEYDADGWQAGLTSLYPGVRFAAGDGGTATAYDGDRAVSTYDPDGQHITCVDQKALDFFGAVGEGPLAERDQWEADQRALYPDVEFRDGASTVVAVSRGRVVSQLSKEN